MAGQVSINDQSFVVAAALVNGVAKYQAVVLDTTAHEVNLGAAANAPQFIGIAQEDQDAGAMVSVRVDGLSYALAAGAINVGDPLVIGSATGQLASAAGMTGANIVGYAIEAATTAGDMFLMVVRKQVGIKKITGTTNATANTTSAFAHGLGYAPTMVILTSRGAGYVYEGAAADATNINVLGSASALAFDAYVS